MIYYILFALCLINATWIYFCAIMRLQMVRDAGQLQGIIRWIAYPNLAIGLVLDTLLNWFIVSILLLELPQEFLTTKRLCRWYENAPLSWRGKLAAWMGRALLNPIDPSGKHIK